MAVNKVIYGGETLIDLTGDTVSADKILSGYTAHDKSGTSITGSCTYDSDTSDATASVSEILKGKTAYVRGAKVTGDMPNRGQMTGVIGTASGKITITQGYHDGSGYVQIDPTESAKIISGNIKNGVTILGVTGNYSGDSVEVPQPNKNIIPLPTSQVITPDSGYTCLSQVTVGAISYEETGNSAGGITVTIGENRFVTDDYAEM